MENKATMKLIVKTLNGKQLPIEIDIESSVRTIKEKIETDHQLKADSLKLIAYGKVLDSDDKTAKDFNLKDGDFIVAMVQKARPPPKEKPKAAEPKPEPVQQPAQPTANTAANTNPAATTTAATQPTAAATTAASAQPTQPAAAQNQALPPEVEAAVNELMAISGKPKELCLQALAAANNAPDLAFEFLMSGNIPEAAADDDYGDEGDAGDLGGADLGNLDPGVQQAIQALMNNPQFPLIRQRMIQDPNFSQQFMQQLAQTQPQIFQAIQQNPGILMQLILGHNPMAGGGAGGPGGPGAGAAGGMPGMPGGGQQRPPPGSIQVTPEEMAAIDRLTSLGFPKGRAAEAYFACDKNEEMAANFLFESGVEDEGDAIQRAINESTQQQPGAGAANQPPAEVNANQNSGQPSSEGVNAGNEGGQADNAQPAEAQPAQAQPAQANQDANMQNDNQNNGEQNNNQNNNNDGGADGNAGGSSLA